MQPEDQMPYRVGSASCDLSGPSRYVGIVHNIMNCSTLFEIGQVQPLACGGTICRSVSSV